MYVKYHRKVVYGAQPEINYIFEWSQNDMRVDMGLYFVIDLMFESKN
jgi:hypothetical protein